MKTPHSAGLSFGVALAVAVIAAVAAAALITTIVTLVQPQRTSAQTTPSTPTLIDSSEFSDTSDTLTITAGETRIISGAVDFRDGDDSITNTGMLIVRSGASIDNLELLTQLSATATLAIEIAEDPNNGTVLDLGGTDINISAGEIHLLYTGEWNPDPREPFTLFATRGSITIPSSVRITDNIGNTDPGYTGTRFGTTPNRFNVQGQRYTPADILMDTDFTGGADTLTIAAGETRVISGELDLGGTENKIVNEGTLIIKSDSTITGLAEFDGYVQTAKTATLAFDIDLVSPPAADIVRFAAATNDTFRITGGNMHFNYLGAWIPAPAPAQTFTLFDDFDLFGDVSLNRFRSTPSTDGDFTLTHSAYGNPTDLYHTSTRSTEMRVLIPQGAVIGGTNPTFTPVFTDEDDNIFIRSSGSLQIAGDLNLLGGTDTITNEGNLTIDEGVTIASSMGDLNFIQNDGAAELVFNLTRNEASTAAAVNLPDTTVAIGSGSLHVNYGGTWEPSPSGGEFTLIGDIGPSIFNEVPSRKNTSHSQDFTDIALSISEDGTSIIATTTSHFVDGSAFGTTDDALTIESGETRVISGALDFGAGNDSITNVGTLIVKPEASIDNLELLKQTSANAALRIEIAEDPDGGPVIDLGSADATISGGEIQLLYTGSWRPGEGDTFALFATRGTVDVSPSVRITDIGDDASSDYTGTQSGTDPTDFNVRANPPRYTPDDIIDSSEFTDESDTFIVAAGETRVISGELDLGGRENKIVNEGNLIIKSGSTVTGLAELDGYVQTAATATLIFDIDLNLPPAADIANFASATDDTFTITSGNIHLNYLGDWVPAPAPVQDFILFDNFDLFGDVSLDRFGPTPGTDGDFTLTHSAYGNPTDSDNTRARSEIRVLIPQGAVIGGPNPTFTPIFTNGNDRILVRESGSLRIAGDLNLLGGNNDRITNEGKLTIDEGVTITGLGSLVQFFFDGLPAELVFNLTRNEASTAAVVNLSGGDTLVTGGNLHVNYGGGWEPSPSEEEFTLIGGVVPTVFTIENASHSQDTSDIALRISEDGTSIIATTTSRIVDGSAFGATNDVLTIEAGETRIISGALEFEAGNDSITNAGTLIVKPEASIDNLELLKQTSANATLRIEIAEDPDGGPVIDLGSADAIISGGEIQLLYTGSWRPGEGDTFALFATRGTVDVSPSVRITDIGDDASSDYTGTQSGTDPTDFNVRANPPRYTPDDIIDSSEFTDESDTFIVAAGETRVISGELDLGGRENKIVNEGNLIIKSGSTITGLAEFDGYVQTATTATLTFDIDLNSPPTTDIARFAAATDDTFTITSGRIHFNYLGDWRPVPLQVFTLFDGFDLFEEVSLGDFGSPTPSTDGDFTLTHSAYGDPVDFDNTSTFLGTVVWVLIPEGAVIGGTNPTFTPRFTDGDDSILVRGSGSLRIAGDLDLLEGDDTIQNAAGKLTIDEGVTIEGLGANLLGGIIQFHENAELVFNLTRNEASTAVVVNLSGGGTLIGGGSLHVNYGGGWEPSPSGEEFTLIDDVGKVLLNPQNISHSQDFTDIALSISEDETSIIATVTSRIVDDSTFGATDDALTIEAGETRIISDALDFGAGNDSITNEGTLIVKSGASIDNLELLTQVLEEAILTIEIADDPGNDPVLDLGSADITISSGEIRLLYTGSWRPEARYTFTLFSTSGSVAVSTSVRITDNDDATNFDYASTQSGTAPTDFNVRAIRTLPTLLAPDLAQDDDTGSSNQDNITNETTLTFTGDDAEADATVTVTATLNSGTATNALATPDENGDYSADLTLTEGIWRVTATQTADTFTSAQSTVLTVTIDTAPPVISGTIPNQTIIGRVLLILGDVTQLFVDGNSLSYEVTSSDTTVAAASLDNENHLRITGATAGVTTIEVTAVDLAGNRATLTFMVTVENPVAGTPPPLSPPNLAGGSDNGSSNQDNITNDIGPIFNGQRDITAATVTVTATPVAGAAVTANASLEPNGTYSAELNLTEGVWQVTATQTNGGLTSEPSTALQVTIDATDPTVSGTVLTSSDTNYPLFANVNDRLTLTFDVDEPLGMTPTVTIGAQPADVSKAGLTYTATRTVYGNEDQGGVNYVITNIADIAGNTAATMTVTSTIAIDTIAPTFQGQPSLQGAAADGVITEAESGAQNIINVRNANANDVIAFAVRANVTGICRAISETFITAEQFDASDLTIEGDNHICVRLTDQAGNAPNGVFPPFGTLKITRNIVIPSVREGENIPDQTVTEGETVIVDDITQFFTDTDALRYSAGSSNPNVASATVRINNGRTVIGIIGVTAGVATIAVTAEDTAGQTAGLTFMVTVKAPNFPPTTDGSIPDRTITGGQIVTVDDITQFFMDTDTLTYSASSSNIGVATVMVESDSDLTIEGVAAGTVTITVTAKDTADQIAIQAFMVTVTPPILAAPNLADGSDTGSSNQDSITNQTTLTFNGQGAITTAIVAVTATPDTGTALTISASLEPNGNYSADLTLPQGIWQITATQTVNGLTSAPSTVLTVTVDITNPTLSGAALTNSDMTYTNFANVGDDLTLTFTVDEALGMTPTVTIGGQPADVSKAGLTYTAVRTVNGDEDEGTVEYVITNIADIAGNTVATMTVTSTIAIDTAVPTISGVNLTNSDMTYTNFANVNDVLTLTFTVDEALGMTPTVTIGGQPAVVSKTGLRYTATREVDGTEDQGDVTYVISDIADIAGNTVATMTVTSDIIDIDTTAPRTTGSIPAQNLDTGRTLTLDLAQYFSDGNALTYTAGSDNTDTATVRVSGNNLTVTAVGNGTATITITAKDTAGNQATDADGNEADQEFVVTVATPIIPTLAALNLAQGNDTGSSDEDNITRQTTLTFNGQGAIITAAVTVTATPDIGTALTISASLEPNGNYSVTLDLTEGIWDVTATQTVNAFTSVPSPALQVTIDRTNPTISDATLTNSDTNFANEDDTLTLTFTVDKALGMTPTVTIGGQPAGVSKDNLTYTATREVDGTEDQGDVTYVISDIADIAGNTATNVTVTSDTIDIDTTPPQTTGSIPPQNLDTSRTRELQNLAQYFNNESGLTYTAGSDNTDTATVRVSGNNLTVTAVGTGTATITVTATDAAGNQATQAFNVTVTTPTLSAPDLEAGDDTGSSDEDNITKQTDNLTFSGNDALTSTTATVTVTVTATLISGGVETTTVINGTDTTGADGEYSADLNLTQGIWRLIAAQTVNGFTSPQSAVLTVTVDTEAPDTEDSISARNLDTGSTLELQNIAQYFVAEDGLSYGATSTVPTVATADLDQDNDLTITGVKAGTTTITITATDTAGNQATQEFNVTVLTPVVPTLAALNLAQGNDTGSSDEDNITSQTTLTFNGQGAIITAAVTVTATPDTGTALTISASLEPNGNYSVTLDLTEGIWEVTATQTVNAFTSAPSPALQVTIDRTNPTISDAALTNSDTTYPNFANADDVLTLTFTVDGALGMMPTVTIGEQPADDVSKAGLTYTATRTVRSGATQGTVGYEITNIADIAGNTATDITVTSTPITIDTIDPQTSGSISSLTISARASSVVDDITQYFVTEDGLSYEADSDDTTIATVELDDSSNDLTITGGTPGTATITVTATDRAGNEATQEFTVTVTPPTLAAPDLAQSSDSGSSREDNITNETALTFTGSGAEADAIVTVTATPTSGGASVPGTVTSTSGAYSIALNLAQGVWEVTATQTVNSLNSARSAILTVTVDTAAPTFTNQILIANLHTAVGDGFLNGAEDNASGTQILLEASAWNTNENATVTQSIIARNTSAPVCNGTDAAQDLTPSSDQAIGQTDLRVGDINYESGEGFGNHYICATATDPAGNEGYSQPVGPIVRDTTAPTFQPGQPTPQGAAADGIINADENTADAQNIINVGNTHSNDLIAFAVQSTNAGATCNAAFGAFTTAERAAQFDVSDLISEGNNYICVMLTDQAGNTPSTVFASSALTIMRNSTAPSATVSITSQTVNVGLTVAVSNVANFFSDTEPLAYSVISSDPSVATVTVNESTSNLTITGVTAGTADITVTATDTARQTAEQTFTVTVNNPVPTTDGRIPDQTVAEGGTAIVSNVAQFFSDPGDTLTYSAGSSDPSVATVMVESDNDLTIEGVAAGTVTITVTATDTARQTVQLTFGVDVVRSLAAPNLAQSSDVGSRNDDNITSETTLTFTGNDAEAGATVTVTATLTPGGASIGGSATSTSGAYSVTLALTQEGDWEVKVTQTVNSFTSVPSPALRVTIDTTDPTISGANLTNSDTNYPLFANEDDTLTLTFNANEALGMTPTVTIGGQSASVSKVGLRYTATRTVNGSEDQGDVTYVITDIADIAGNNIADPVTETSDTIDIDTEPPAFQSGQPTLQDEAADRLIEYSEREARNIINVGDTHDNDLIAFAVRTDANATCNAAFGDFTTSAQFDAEDLRVEGDNYICVRLTDQAGNDPAFTSSVLTITRNITRPSVRQGQAIPTPTVAVGLTVTVSNVDRFFTDTDDTLTYSASSNNEGVATVTFDESTNNLTITGVTVGTATITVTATDTATQTAELTFTVAVETNPRPTTDGTIPDQVVTRGQTVPVRNLARFFSDPGDTLTYSASSNSEGVATAMVESDNDLTIEGVAAGTTDITVTATDSAGGTAEQTFEVEVIPPLSAPDLAQGSDTGSSDEDNITNQTTGLIFTGDDAQPNTSVTVTATPPSGTAVIRSTTTSNIDGDYSVTFNLNQEGIWEVTATQLVNGLISPPSAILTVTVDTEAPTFTSQILILNLHAAVHNGFLNSAEVLAAAAQTQTLLAVSAWTTNENATVTQSIIARNGPPPVCNGTDAAQDLTPSSDQAIDRSDLFVGDINYESGGFGNHYICATATDPAGNEAYSRRIGPIIRDTTLPAFQPNQPSLRGAAADGLITEAESGAQNIINVGNTHANDIIAFAVATAVDIRTICNDNFGGFTAATQFNASDLRAEGDNFVCVRLIDQSAPSFSHARSFLKITRNTTPPSVSDETIRNRMLVTGHSRTIRNVSGQYFQDTPNDTLTIQQVRSSNSGVVSVAVDTNNDSFTIEAVAVGVDPATITVTVEDTAGQTAEQSFEVTVISRFDFEFLLQQIGNNPIASFTIVELPAAPPDAPTSPGTPTLPDIQFAPPPPPDVEFVSPAYDVTPIDTTGNELTQVSTDICLPFGDHPRPTRLFVYHYNDGAWEQLPSYINDANTHVCGTTESFSVFVLGATTGSRQTAPAGLLPPTGGIAPPSIWVIIAAAVGGIMALIASTAFGLRRQPARAGIPCTKRSHVIKTPNPH